MVLQALLEAGYYSDAAVYGPKAMAMQGRE
jgi:hypothetical protein